MRQLLFSKAQSPRAVLPRPCVFQRGVGGQVMRLLVSEDTARSDLFLLLALDSLGRPCGEEGGGGRAQKGGWGVVKKKHVKGEWGLSGGGRRTNYVVL